MAETFYIPNDSGWQSSSGYTNYYLRMHVSRSYDVNTNKSTFTVKLEAKNASIHGWHTITGGSLVCGGNTYTLPGSTVYSINLYSDWKTVQIGSTDASWSFEKTHNADGSLTVSFGVSGLTLKYSYGAYYGSFSGSSSKSFNEPRASTISCTASVATLGTFSLSVNRASSAFYHKATITAGGSTLYTSAAFATAMADLTVPRSWFGSFGSVTSFTATVSVQTYTDSSCTTTVGDAATATFTVTADSGMKPALAAGFAAAAALNTGTAAAGITGYVQGISKARITLDATKVTHAAGASLGSYTVSCQNYTGTGSGTSYDTDVLTGDAAITVTVTVTDSRGRSESTSLTVTPMTYGAPTLSDVSAYRSNSGGTADEDGTYYAVQATVTYSGLDGQNSASLIVQKRTTGGSYGTATSLTSGVQSVLSTVDPDLSYEVLFTATDALGSSATALVRIATRQWAMKFRTDGKGVAFGKAPIYGNAVEIPESWAFRQGERRFAMAGQASDFTVDAQGQGAGFQFNLTNTYGEAYRLRVTESNICLDKQENNQWITKWTL